MHPHVLYDISYKKQLENFSYLTKTSVMDQIKHILQFILRQKILVYWK